MKLSTHPDKRIRWAENKRVLLLELLGNKCAHCGLRPGDKYKNGKLVKIEIDVIVPTGDNRHHRTMGRSGRICFYFRQLKNHNIQLLCEKCNKSKQNKELEEYYEPDPF